MKRASDNLFHGGAEMADRAASYDSYLKQHRSEQLAELNEFLRIPSISALSEHKPDVRRAAEFLAKALHQLGFDAVEVIPTKGHPLVYGERLEGPGRPTVLVYGHYDVQPVDPLNLWETPPFEPAIRDGQLYARGASDDKGPVFMHLKAVETLLAVDGRLPVNLKFLVEGEEEVGGEHLDEYIRTHREKLAADAVVISDTTMYARGLPAICTGLRGLTALQVDVYGANTDLHSGLFGGAVENPLNALARLVASLHTKDGAVAVSGFYDRVRPATPAELESIASLPFADGEYQAELGVPALAGEPGYSTLERLWVRPTLDANGMWGGFQGEGTKTVIPSEGHVKITCRLVPDQEPAEIFSLVAAHLKRNCPPGVRIEVRQMEGARPSVVSTDHPAVEAAAHALQESYGVKPAYIRMGGSIPVVQTFQEELQAPVVLIGFGLPDEKFHAPNEHFDLGNFDLGLRTLCRYWNELAAWQPKK